MKQMHFAHRGIKETVRQIASHYYWTDMKAEITRFVQTCHNCQSNKPSKMIPPHYGQFSVPDQRFTHIHLDIVGPLPISEGYKYLFTAVDRTTRLFFAWPITEPSAKECSQQLLLHYVSLFGIPLALGFLRLWDSFSFGIQCLLPSIKCLLIRQSIMRPFSDWNADVFTTAADFQHNLQDQHFPLT